ncbi:MAG: hypothetical protein CVU39_24405 [Chloroflexi bacterium HGW-Chloroflexi-10]|nr:MAG: hypothetical protein CVU39_24405 [Chloroflexi bacterium HGW-Chloroflexi-10]
MAQINRTTRRSRRPIVFDKITVIILVVFIVLAIASSVAVFNLVKNIVTGWTITPLEGLAIDPQSGDPSNSGEIVATLPAGPVQPEGGPTPEPWDGTSRVTILVMGLDYRDWEAGEVARTDTMMLLSLDPLSHTASIMSVPRDMWVNVPGFDYNKINTAYYLGEIYDLPGGGPALAMETVEQFLGVPISYYAQIDFMAFERFIDELKGIHITPTQNVTLAVIGSDYKQELIAGETVTLPGNLALAYARARYTEGGDFDRASRQQEVVLAIRDRILDYTMLPTLIAKAPILYQEIAAGIHTNLSFDEAFQLATFAINIDRSKIKTVVIDPSCVQFGKSPDGLDILIPIPDKIRLLRDEAFTTGGPVGPATLAESTDPAVTSDPFSLVKAENARLSIQNGSWLTGLAASTATYLRDRGFNIQEETNGEASDITTIYLYNGKPATVQAIFDMFEAAGLSKPRLYNRTDLNGQFDLTVILGNDWANYVSTNPLQ